jgi:hypothetical protein
MKKKITILVMFTFFFVFSSPDNRSISIIINNNNSNINKNDNDNLIKKKLFDNIDKSTESSMLDFFIPTKKKIMFFVFLLFIYYLNFFKISSVLNFFIFLKNKIINKWVSRKKNQRKKYNV